MSKKSDLSDSAANLGRNSSGLNRIVEMERELAEIVSLPAKSADGDTRRIKTGANAAGTCVKKQGNSGV